ncbi:MAG TPA: alpha/beta fold hydrolase [Stellaceae bacterium]|nr:alpha/beta fold hydrolase [Stellaceae bacterium]
MAQPTESILELDGCRLLLRRAGHGAPLLFLHGANGFPGWLRFFDALSDRFEVIAPDHPSFGRSSTPDWLDEVGDLAYFYLDLIDALGLDGVHLVGHSMGGWIACELAVRSAARLKTLTLIDAAGIRIKGKPIADILVMDREDVVRAAFADPKMIEMQLAMSLTPAMQEQLALNRVAAARLAWQPRFFNPHLRKWMHRIAVPTRIVWGDRDGIIPPDYAAAFQALIPGSTVVMVAGTAHSPHVEKPEAVLDAIAALVAGT